MAQSEPRFRRFALPGANGHDPARVGPQTGAAKAQLNLQQAAVQRQVTLNGLNGQSEERREVTVAVGAAFGERVRGRRLRRGESVGAPAARGREPAALELVSALRAMP